MEKILHKAILRLITFLNIAFLTVPFAIVWFYYYADRIVTPYYGRGNLLVIALFVLLYVEIGRAHV